MLFVFLHFRFLWKMSVLETISFLNCFLVHFYSRMSQIRSAPSSLLLVKKNGLGALSYGTPILRHPHLMFEHVWIFCIFWIVWIFWFVVLSDFSNFWVSEFCFFCAFWIFSIFWVFYVFLNFLCFLNFQCFLNIRGFLYFLNCFFNLN